MSIKRRLISRGKKLIPRPLLPLFTSLRNIQTFYPPYLFSNGLAKPPDIVEIEITHRCNCRCRMCALHENREISDEIERRAHDELPIKAWKEILDDLSASGVRQVTLSGGEPLVKEQLAELLSHARHCGLAISIITNGSLIDRSMAELLVDLPVDLLMISLDGPRQVHNTARRQDVFDAVMDGIDLIQMEKKRRSRQSPRMLFLCTITKMNQSDLTDVLEIGHAKRMPVYFSRLFYTTENMLRETDAIYPLGAAKTEDQISIGKMKTVDVDVLYDELQRLKATARDHPVEYRCELRTRKDIQSFYYDDNFSFASKCFYPWQSARIDPRGIVYPCSMNTEMGNLMETSFAEIWNGPRYVHFRQALKKVRIFPKCRKCCELSKWHAFRSYLPSLPAGLTRWKSRPPG